MTRVIARLDIKSADLIKGTRFEGLRKIGDPKTAEITGLSGIALGSALHFGQISISDLKEHIEHFGRA